MNIMRNQLLVNINKIILFFLGLINISFANGLGFNYLTLNSKYTTIERSQPDTEYFLQYNGFTYHMGLMIGYIIIMLMTSIFTVFYFLIKNTHEMIRKKSHPQLIKSIYHCQLKQLVHLNEIFNYLELDNYGIEKITYGFYIRHNNLKQSKSKFSSRLVMIMKSQNKNVIKYCITRMGSVTIYGCRNYDNFLESLSHLRYILEYGYCIVINNKYINVRFIDNPMHVSNVKCQNIIQFNMGQQIDIKKLASLLKCQYDIFHIRNYENKKSHVWVDFDMDRNITGSAQIYFNGDVYCLVRAYSHDINKASHDLYKVISNIISSM